MTTGLTFDITIKTTAEEMQKMALRAMRDFLNTHLQQVANEAKVNVRGNLKDIFIATDTYRSLVSGPLDAHFGIPAGEAPGRLDQILDVLVAGIEIQFVGIRLRGNSSLTGGLVVKIGNADFSDILSLPAAEIETKKEKLPWLKWLLTLGDEIIVRHYDIKFGDYSNPPSRSEQAIMIKSRSGMWKVPIGVSGTVSNNWITRTIRDSKQLIEDIIDKAIEDAMEKVF